MKQIIFLIIAVLGLSVMSAHAQANCTDSRGYYVTCTNSVVINHANTVIINQGLAPQTDEHGRIGLRKREPENSRANGENYDRNGYRNDEYERQQYERERYSQRQADERRMREREAYMRRQEYDHRRSNQYNHQYDYPDEPGYHRETRRINRQDIDVDMGRYNKRVRFGKTWGTETITIETNMRDRPRYTYYSSNPYRRYYR